MPKKKETTIVKCPECEARVTGIVLGKTSKYYYEIDEAFEVSLVECQECSEPMVTSAMFDHYCAPNEQGFKDPIRVWPEPKKYFSPEIPQRVASSLSEAVACYESRAYIASLIMCRRAIEQLCLDKGIKKQKLFFMVKDLKQKGIVDGKLYQWAEALKDNGNLAAHDKDFIPKKVDVADLIDFSRAICDYVYVLEEKYQEFLRRQSNK